MYKFWATLSLVSVFVCACGGAQKADKTQAEKDAEAARRAKTLTSATAVLHPTKNSVVTGIVHFTKQDGGILVDAEFQGLEPGKHGFHIHEVGDCSDPEGKSAGGHFNPHGADHGSQDSPVRHAGDFGNVDADEKGAATAKFLDSGLQMEGPDGIIGRSVIIHASEDDLTSQPTGNSGARMACGIIKPN